MLQSSNTLLYNWRVLNPCPLTYPEADALLAGGDVLMFFGADKENGEIFRSERYAREKGRQNMWVQVRWESPSVPYVCKVLFYLLIRARGSHLRLAVCDVYNRLPLQGGMHVAQGQSVAKVNASFPVDVLCLDHKLVAVMPEGHDCGKMYFLPYRNMSKSR